MREILFRGKRVDNGEWVCGHYLPMTHTDNRHTHHFIVPIGSDMNYGQLLENVLVEVIPETVGQHTGLTDENGKKIFEGDIVRVFEGERFEFHAAEVFYRKDIGQFRYTDKWLFNTTRDLLHIREADFSSISLQQTEIIGNKHDNPELLEER